MLNTHRKYIPLDKVFCTRVIYHAHMEQHSKISATDETVITKLYQKEDKKSIS